MQDFTRYTDITSVDDIFYSLKINQEPAIVTDQTDIISNIDSGRSYDPTQVVRLLTKHAPITNISSVDNFVTGEKYKVEFFTSDGSVYISGRTLPGKNDIVLISYEWKKFFDPMFDYELSENAILWSGRNSTVADLNRSALPSSTPNNTFWPNTAGLVYPTSGVATIPPMTTPTEMTVTTKTRGLNNRAVYIQGTSMTTVLNQSQRLSQDPALDSSNSYLIFYIIPPYDSRTGVVVGGVYDRDVISSYRVLAKKGDYIGRVYPSDNYLNLDGPMTTPGTGSKIIFQNISAGEAARAVDYVISESDQTYVGVKVSDIGAVPKAGDTISMSFLWEVRHPISQGANISKSQDGSYLYILGSQSGASDSIIRDVNNSQYINPNSGLSNLGNYDKIAFIGSVNSTNNRQTSYKRFVSIDRISVSDVQSPSDATFNNIKIQRFQSPIDNTGYTINYTYKAPKESERITVSYLYNKLINNVTKAVESQRLINTDILVKAGIEVPIAVGLSVVISDGINPVSAQSAITTAISQLINSSTLGGSLEPSYVTSELFKSVGGLVSVNFTRFSRLSDSGGVKAITFKDSEYYSIEPANITVVVSSGKGGIYTNYFTQGSTNPSFKPTGQPSTCASERLIVADPQSCAPDSNK